MDFRFFCGASPGLAVPFLKGNERVQLLNLHPDGALSFTLPDDRPKIGVDIGNGLSEPQVVLQTVQIRCEDAKPQVDLVWRGAVPYPGLNWLPEMKRLDVVIE